MYQIRLSDGSPIYCQGDSDYTAYDIVCETVKGDSGFLQFTIPKENPAYGTLQTRKSVLEFSFNGESLGFYEVREITHDVKFSENVYAVGELAWLFDSIQPQAEFHDVTPRGFLEQLLKVHNTQCPDHAFLVGIVDVTDANNSLYRYTNRETTLDDIREKLVERLGGQIKLRRVGNTRYLDYLTDDTYGSESTQRIYFGENMLDYSDTMTSADVCSSVIPLGCTLDNDKADNSTIGNLEKRLTIESVNDGKDWISDSSLVARFGNVRVVAIWDDVTVASNLLKKAKAWLKSDQFEMMHLTVKAVDLSLTSAQFGKLRMGDFVTVVAPPYGLNRRFPIVKRTYHPDEPDTDEIELGDNVAISFIDSQNATKRSMASSLGESSYQQTQWLTEAIDNVTAMMKGDRGGYKLTEYDSDGRWLADYYMDSPDKNLARVVHKVNMNGDAYSTNGINGEYETAIMANGTILGKFIQAHSIKAEQISQDYTRQWEDADTKTLNTCRTEFKAADGEIAARVTKTETAINGVKTDLAAEIKVRADQISQTVKRGQINSTIKQTAETIYIESNKFGWKSDFSSLSTDGKIAGDSAKFNNININGGTVNGEFSINSPASTATWYARANAKVGFFRTTDYRMVMRLTGFSLSSNQTFDVPGFRITSPASNQYVHIIPQLSNGTSQTASQYHASIYSSGNMEIHAKTSAANNPFVGVYSNEVGICAGGHSDGMGYYTKIDTSGNVKIRSKSQTRIYVETLINPVLTVSRSAVSITENLSVSGTKSRLVTTDNYADRLLYSYETPSPLFGDVGSGVIGDDGVCLVEIDDVFSETVRTDMGYQVFLQKCGRGDLWVSEKSPTHFVVEGTAGLPFDWEIKAHQKDYEYERIDQNGVLDFDDYNEYLSEIESLYGGTA